MILLRSKGFSSYNKCVLGNKNCPIFLIVNLYGKINQSFGKIDFDTTTDR